MLARVELAPDQPPPPPLFQPAEGAMIESHPAPVPAYAPAHAGDSEMAMDPVSGGVLTVAAQPIRTDAVDPNDPSTWHNAGRNAPCPCGSGKKYKHCHGRLG